jgi:predicted alpha/beta-fold hydrolase
MKKRIFLIKTIFCLLLCSGLANASIYGYPFTDRHVATVLGTPPEFAAVVPKDIPTKTANIKMFPERKVPGVLFPMDVLYYSYQRQDGPAPLIFLIAGTGASFKSLKMIDMQRAFYDAGFNVVSLSSPTHPNFIAAGSTSGVPGHLEEDSADLYNVMKAVWQKLQNEMNVTEFYLTGYSLGAAQSAFVAKLDEQEKAFNFSKVLMINPPVSLYNSVVILDDMLENNIPGGMDNFDEFYQRMIKAFGDAYAHGKHVEFNDNFLYEVYKFKKPKDDEPLEALIGISFRISSENMAFTSDVITRAGYVVPKDLELGREAHTVPYVKVLGRLTFVDYFRGIFMPHFQALDPNVTEPEMIQELSLYPIEEYLRNSPKIGLIGNEDDIILRPGEIDYLRDVFGSRATIFPHGGHCGNMAYPDNVKAMIGFFQTTQQN